jgi:hypothetical protein
MRSLLLGSVCFAVLGLCALLSAGPEAETVQVRLRLLYADSGRSIAGIVRVFPDKSDKTLALPGLFDRLRGLPRSTTVAGWHVVPAEGAMLTLPRSELRLEALSGLETALVRQDIDLAKQAPDEIALKLPFLFRPEEQRLVAGNTHLHLRNLTRSEADDYLRQVPAADGLKVLFISYLERFEDDRDYITNHYPIGDPKIEARGLLINNGEEHRHNFEAQGQGYGHVMLLNIKQLVKPVSLGRGITKAGFDDRALAPGIAEARKQGGTVIWCHNTFGHEGLPRALAGQLDALNVFDGSRTGTYEERYYPLLNVGRRLPISTGTDWFMYDFSRVYAKVPGLLTVQSWLDAVKAGRCGATNGPLLTLTVDGNEPGDVLALEQPRSVKIAASAVGRHDFEKLQLVRNGSVIQTVRTEGKRTDGAYRVQLTHEVRIDEPSWFAVRIEANGLNEFEQKLFAHGSPVYVDLAGKRVFDVEAARTLLKQLEEARADIRAKGLFSNEEARDRLLALYQETTQALVRQINQRGR